MRRNPELTPGQRIQSSIDELICASKKVDALVCDIIRSLNNRQEALADLEGRNVKLALQEETLRKRIAALKDVPIEVAEYFQQINRESLVQIEKRTIIRDFLMVVLGTVFAVVVSALLNSP